MDIFRKIFEAMNRQQKPTPQTKTDLVVVGRLTDEEILRLRQLEVMASEMGDLARQAKLKKMEADFRQESLFQSLKDRLGITFASHTNITDDYLVRIPRDEAAKHGVISE